MKYKILNQFSGDFQSFYRNYLQDVKAISGDEYQAICPFHDDHNPSLNFNNQTGKFFCHGCGEKGDIFHFFGKLNNIDTHQNFSKILQGITRDFGISDNGDSKPRIVKIYDYLDESGKPLFQVCRMEPKSFRQRYKNGNGKWVWNLKGVRRVLYNLPAILEADEVIVVEGEKDVETLRELDFVATTSPMGAKKWRPEYSEFLRGKSVVLIPDNDDEGREHMTRVAQALTGVAKSIKWLYLPDLPDKGDVSDWVARFNGDKKAAVEKLASMIYVAKLWEPPKKLSLENVIFKTNQFVEFNIPDRREFLSPWLKENAIVLISGWRGCGKTWLALGLLDSITRGEPFGPWKCEYSAPSLLLDGEMPPQDINERILNLSLDSKRPNPFYIYSDALANQSGLPRANIADENWRQKMKSILIARNVKIWVIDNIASLASGLDENKKADWDPINQWLLDLRFAGVSTIMLHHTGKEGQQRGTSAREDNLDISVILRSPNDYVPEDGARFILKFSKARVRTRELSLVSDTEFRLIEKKPGRYIWTWKSAATGKKRQVLKLMDSGLAQKNIAETLGVSGAYISKLKRQAIKDGQLNKDGKLTPDGINYVSINV